MKAFRNAVTPPENVKSRKRPGIRVTRLKEIRVVDSRPVPSQVAFCRICRLSAHIQDADISAVVFNGAAELSRRSSVPSVRLKK